LGVRGGGPARPFENVSFEERDCRNYINKAREQEVLRHFVSISVECKTRIVASIM
jgi:hypothetical protein